MWGVLLSLGAALPASAQSPPVVELVNPAEGSEALAPEGHIRVEWRSTGAGLEFDLATSRTVSFDSALVRRVPHDRASTLSGLLPGTTYVRVRAVTAGGATGPWSAPGMVVVDYPANAQVVRLSVLGLLGLATLVAAIIIGWSRTGRLSSVSHDT